MHKVNPAQTRQRSHTPHLLRRRCALVRDSRGGTTRQCKVPIRKQNQAKKPTTAEKAAPLGRAAAVQLRQRKRRRTHKSLPRPQSARFGVWTSVSLASRLWASERACCVDPSLQTARPTRPASIPAALAARFLSGSRRLRCLETRWLPLSAHPCGAVLWSGHPRAEYLAGRACSVAARRGSS